MLLKLCTNAGFSEYRVVREYPNPNTNTNYRVPKIAGSGFSKLNSGNVFRYPNFLLPELPDPKNSVTQTPRVISESQGPVGQAERMQHHRVLLPAPI